MIETPNIWNTGLPLLILGALGWVLPRMLVPEDSRSHTRVGAGVIFAVLALIGVSALVLVALDTPAYSRALEVGGMLLVAEIALRNSALFAIAWVPMLALSWFNMAQRVEALRGRDMVREDGL